MRRRAGRGPTDKNIAHSCWPGNADAFVRQPHYPRLTVHDELLAVGDDLRRVAGSDDSGHAVDANGQVIADDLKMLRLADPVEAEAATVPDSFDLDAMWGAAAEDICREHNAQLDPAAAGQTDPGKPALGAADPEATRPTG